MSLIRWKVVVRKKGTKLNEIKFVWENNLKDVKKQLKKDKYKFIADVTFASLWEEL
ncbi:MAG: hypothetical protein AB7V50_10005 [Vampirovibrionia bacterium]